MDEFGVLSPIGMKRQQALGQQVASAVRREIILGRLQAGTVLPQERLCEAYDVSRIPVRDALFLLSNEGFLVSNRRNQMVVAEFSKEDLLDTFRINAYLSGLSARRAAHVATAAELDELARIISRSEELDDDADPAELARLTWEFHRRINHASKSARLLAALRATSIPLIQDFMGEVHTWWEHTQTEHRAIAEALRDRDPERAESLTFNHFAHAGEALIAYLEGDDDGPIARGSLLDVRAERAV